MYMASSVLKKDSECLLQILNDLLKTSGKENHCISYKTFHCKDGYVIYHVPSDFIHPLKDIVNSVQNSFFLVSKLPKASDNLHDESTEDDTKINHVEHPDQQAELTLPIVTQQHVFVGTPISQKLYHLFQQKNLHDREADTIEKFVDLSGLEKLELKYTQYFMSLYTQCLRCQKDLPGVWLVCNQNNKQGVTYMGMVPCATPDQSKLSGKSVQPVSTVLLRSKNFDGNNFDEFTISEQKKQHMVFYRASHAETHGYCRYNIYGDVDSFGKDTYQQGSSITMEFAWDGVRKMLEPPPPSSNALLNICAHPSDVRNILLGITSEVDLVVKHFTVVQDKLRELDATGAENEEEEFDHEELKKKVLVFLDDLKRNSFGPSEPKPKSVSETAAVAAPFGIGEALQRQDLDNTESFWLFLKDLTSASRMKFCLEVIFELLIEGEYQPVLYATNQTMIAAFMKEVISCNTDQEKANVKAKLTQAVTTCNALQCVVDIGLEKLRHDYTNYFIQQALVTKDRLDYYLAKDVLMGEKVQRLLKLHCILSLVALAISYAHITYDDLRELVAAALKFYENHSHTEHPLFSLSLPAFSASSSNVKNVCIRQFQPQTWIVAITTDPEYITVIQMELDDQFGNLLESFIEQEKSVKGDSYLATTATVSQIYI